MPPGYETEFAEAEVEIRPPQRMVNQTVSSFALTDPSGNRVRMKRVIEVRVRDIGRGESWPWDGVLPSGPIHLSIHVALLGTPDIRSRCSVTVGPYVAQGPVTGAW